MKYDWILYIILIFLIIIIFIFQFIKLLISLLNTALCYPIYLLSLYIMSIIYKSSMDYISFKEFDGLLNDNRLN